MGLYGVLSHMYTFILQMGGSRYHDDALRRWIDPSLIVRMGKRRWNCQCRSPGPDLDLD